MEFLQTGMDAGEIRKQDPAFLLFTLYTAVVGSLTEASVLNAMVGANKSRASLKRREREVLSFVRGSVAAGSRVRVSRSCGSCGR